MALLYIDGFDLNGSTADETELLDKGYTEVTTGVNFSTSTNTPFSEGGSLNFSQPSEKVRRDTETTNTTIVIGFHNNHGATADYEDTPINQEDAILTLWEDTGTSTTTPQVSFVLGTDGGSGHTIIAKRGAYNGTTLGTSSAALADGMGWHYLEFKVLISDTVGTVDIELDGTNILTLTSQDTKNGTTTTVGSFQLSQATNSAIQRYLDNLYLCDGSGSKNNDFLGEVRVRTILPDTDTATIDWTAQGAGSHFSEVDDFHDGDTTYIHSATVTDVDRMTMVAIPTAATVVGVQTVALARKDNVDPRSIRTLVKSGATTSNDSTVVLGDSYDNIINMREDDPNTAATWTAANVNLLEIGVEVIS